MQNQLIKALAPLLLLFLLLGILWHELYYNKTATLPSALIGKPVPNFNLPNLLMPELTFNQNYLKGSVSLINIWATWCEPCLMEHAMLLKIKNEYHIPIFGINYKDNSEKASAWLKERGNPYIIPGSDQDGNVGIDFGIYGTPETYVLNASGEIIYRHVGILDQKSWDETLWPLIKKLQG